MDQSVVQDNDVTVLAQTSNPRSRVPKKNVVESGYTNGASSQENASKNVTDTELIVLSGENTVCNGVYKYRNANGDGGSKVIEMNGSPVPSPSLDNDSTDTSLTAMPSVKRTVISATFTKPSEQQARKCGRCGKMSICKLKTIGTTCAYFCDEICLRLASRSWKASSIQIIAKRTASPPGVDLINAAVNNILLKMNASPPSIPIQTLQPIPQPTPVLSQPISKTVEGIVSADGPPPAKRPNIQPESPSAVNEPRKAVTAVFRCEQCSQPLDPSSENTLYWEAMAYCGESCLGEYQQGNGSFCSVCSNAVQPESLGRHCVRFGYDIKQFCSLPCLQQAKTIHKLCTYCQRGMGQGETCIAHEDSSSVNVVGKRTVRFFCSVSCVDVYKRLVGSNKGEDREMGPCAVCLAVREAFKQFYFQDRLQQFCSEPCYNAFLFVNKVVLGHCTMCEKLYDTTSHSAVQMLEPVKRTALSFCSRCCQNVYLTSNRVVTPCAYCNVKKYNFDMICKGGGAPGSHFCSVSCLTQAKAAGLAKIYIRHPCYECHQLTPLMYHAVPADGIKRSFCSKKCMDKFQKRQKLLPPPSSASTPPLPSSGTTTMTRDTQSSEPGVLPIITKVTSLAPLNTSTAAALSSGLSKESGGDIPVVDVDSPSQEKHKTPTALNASSATPRRSLVISIPMQHFLMNVGTEPVPQHNKVIQCGPIMVSAHSQTEQESEGKNEEKEREKVKEAKDDLPVPTRQFCEFGTQTEPWTPLLPIPVPIYVPVPVPLFNFPYPVPLGVPIPLPLPIPVPAHSLSVATKEVPPVQESQSEPNPVVAEIPATPSVLPSATPESLISPEAPIVALPSKVLTVEKQQESCTVRSSNQDSQDPKCRSISSSDNRMVEQSALPMAIPVEMEEAFRKEFSPEGWPPRCPQVALGQKMWELWVDSENKRISDSLKLKAGPASRKPKLIESDLPQISAANLSNTLLRMVREIKKKDGTRFLPDSLYYVGLGVQEYLTQNDRKDCIFYDKEYSEFQTALNEICKDIVQLRAAEERLSEVREEHLWEAKLLGTETPQVLLFTLTYFNTKYLGLKSVQDHQRLSFKHLIKRWRRIPETNQRVPTSLTYTPVSNSEGGDNASKAKVLPSCKLLVREDKKEKCAIRIYEFYLSKCPQDADPQGKFYLSPVVGSSASDAVWYSKQTQPEKELRVNLERISAVRDVQEMY